MRSRELATAKGTGNPFAISDCYPGLWSPLLRLTTGRLDTNQAIGGRGGSVYSVVSYVMNVCVTMSQRCVINFCTGVRKGTGNLLIR